jgi:hypothetical protein
VVIEKNVTGIIAKHCKNGRERREECSVSMGSSSFVA